MQKIIVFLLLVVTNTVFGQNVFKYRAYTVQILEFSNNKWKHSQTNENQSILLVIDLDDSQIDIYSESETHLDIITGSKMQTTSEGDSYIKSSCIDQNGTRCDFLLWRMKNDDFVGDLQYSNYKFHYWMVKIN